MQGPVAFTRSDSLALAPRPHLYLYLILSDEFGGVWFLGKGDGVVVHAGFAISRLDEGEAQQTLEALAELEKIAEGQGKFLTFTLQ
jgi:predicted metalloprotease